jgi:FkbM family methyltransferase
MKIALKKILKLVWYKAYLPLAQLIGIKNIEAAFAHTKDPGAFGNQLADLLTKLPQGALSVVNSRVAAYAFLAHVGNLTRLFGVNFVIDAGAHSGQFASTLYGYGGYKGEMHSFEPVKKYYDVLAGWLNHYPGWKAYHAALGDVPGKSVINVGKGHGGTSSLLAQTENLLRFAPDCALGDTEEIVVHRVDELFGEILADPARRVMLKLDVQGFESQVLDSCGDYLSRVKLLQVEMSSIPLYQAQASMGELCTRLEKAGFALVHTCNNFGVRDSIFIDYDFLFVRREELEQMGVYSNVKF